MARYEYPQEVAMFRMIDGEVFEGHRDPEFACFIGDDNDDTLVHPLDCVPLTIAAVLMYEACGGTLETALEACSSRRGRKPDRLFARAHAYQAMKTELGEGC